MLRFRRRSEDRPKPLVGLRARVWARTEGRCWYDGVRLDPTAWHVDHVVPRRFGGTDDFANLAPSCPACNLRKGCRDLESFRALEERRLGRAARRGWFGRRRHRFYFERAGLRLELER